MAYDLFLIDLDDTLLDFKESERLAFAATIKNLGITNNFDKIFQTYQVENRALWKMFEDAKITKDHLRVERFRRVFNNLNISADSENASDKYLQALSQTVVLIDYAVEICEWLSERGEIGILTNGIHTLQTERIKNSKIAPYISFLSVSEACGFAKPDIRFFEHSSKMAKTFNKVSSLMIGDRLEADIQGAHNFGLDACWYNPARLDGVSHLKPKYEIQHLSELKKIVEI